MAAALWRSGMPSAWLDSLQAYPDRLKALEKDGLEQLDRSASVLPRDIESDGVIEYWEWHDACSAVAACSWYRALPAAIAERGEEPYITADELVRIVSALRHFCMLCTHGLGCGPLDLQPLQHATANTAVTSSQPRNRWNGSSSGVCGGPGYWTMPRRTRMRLYALPAARRSAWRRRAMRSRSRRCWRP